MSVMMGNCNWSPSIDSTPIEMLTEDEVTCGICYGLMCQPSTISPCQHTFCGGCLSEWHTKSSYCPYCREFIQLITFNNVVDRSVNALIHEHPHKIRPPNETEEIQNKNNISYDKVFYKSINDIERENARNNLAEYESSENDNDDDHYDEGINNDLDYVLSTQYANIRVSKADIQTYMIVTGDARSRVARETIAGAMARNLSPPLDYAISFHYIRGDHD